MAKTKRIFGPFPILKEVTRGRLKSRPFPLERKVTRGGAGDILLKSEKKSILGWPGSTFLKSGKKSISVPGSKHFQSENTNIKKKQEFLSPLPLICASFVELSKTY